MRWRRQKEEENTTSTIEHNGLLLLFPFPCVSVCGAYPLLTDVLIASDNSRASGGGLFILVYTHHGERGQEEGARI